VNILMSMDFEQKQKNRFLFLKKVYEFVKAKTNVGISNISCLGTELNFSQDETEDIINYLIQERLIEYAGMNIALTHSGLKEVEEILTNPSKATEHFSPINIVNNTINIDSMNHSSLQQSTKNSIINSYFDNTKINELNDIIKEVKNIQDTLDISIDVHKELIAEIQTLESQRESPKPKNNIIKESLNTTKTILEGAMGSAIGTTMIEPILNNIIHFLNGLQ